MAKPLRLRIEYPGAYYHAKNRANRGEYIFLSDKDRQLFLDGLVDSCETHRINLIANVLILNHLHISVEHIISEVAKAGNTQTEDLFDRKTNLKNLRQMAIELSFQNSSCKQKETGAIFGVDYSTVGQSRLHQKAKLKSIRKLKKQFNRIQEHILF